MICLEVRDHQRRVFRLDGDARADGAAADAEVAQIVRRFGHATHAARDRAGVRGELLPEPDGHRVLQVRAPGLHDVVELLALRRQRAAQILERRVESASSCDRHASRMFVGIVSFVDCAMLT